MAVKPTIPNFNIFNTIDEEKEQKAVGTNKASVFDEIIAPILANSAKAKADLTLPTTLVAHTIDDHRKKQEEEKKPSVFDSIVAPVMDEAERKRKIAALLSNPNAPAGMKVSNYLAYLAQNGGMDASTKAAYDAEMEAKAADPKKQSQLAGALAIQKERELADYMASDERKQKAPVLPTVKTDSPMGDLGAFLGQSLFNKLQTGSFTGDEKEGTLRAQKDYFQNLSGSLLAQDTMEKDMQILSTWSPQDKEDLETYLNHSDLAYGRTDVIGSAALDRLNKKFGRDLVAQVAESYSQHLNDQTAAEAEKLGKENHGLLDVAASIPLGWLGSITSTASQARQTVKDTLGLTTGRYKTNDTNTPGDLLSIYTGAVQQGAAEEAGEWGKAAAEAHGASKQVQEFAGKAASTAVQVCIGAADNLARVYLTGGVGSLALAATGSFSSAMREASQKGASPQQALAMGSVSAASEGLTEKLPLDNLLANVGKGANLSNIGKLVTEAAKQAGIELATEEVNLMAGLIAEAGILREKSSYRQSIADAVAGGMSYAEAAKQANRELLQQAGQTALQAGLSGFLTSGASSVISGADGSGRLPQAAETYKQQKADTFSYVQELLRRPAQEAVQPAPQGQTPAADVVEEILNKHDTQQAPPTDPIQELLKLAAQGKPVTNKQATGVLNNPEAVQKLTQETGLDLDGLTASQKRNAVRDAVAALASNQEDVPVDGQKNTASEEVTPKEHISFEDYINRESPVWRNVAYEDEATQASITQDAHERMVNTGAVVKVTDGTTATVEQSFPDLRSMKKKDRTPILKEAINKLKTNIRQFLNGLTNQSFEFEVNGKILDARLYSTGINEVLEKVTKERAKVLYSTEDIFRNAQYLYSTPDYDGDPNVYRWNYFYTPVQIGEDTVGVRIAVRDMETPQESQIYHWGIKKDASLDGVGRGTSSRIPHDVSSDASNNNIPQTPPVVKDNESVGAAPAWFDVNTRLQYEHGTIPDGENPVRPDDLPKRDYVGGKVSETARTVKGAEATPDEFVDLLNKETVEGGLSYVPITNGETTQKAIGYIKAEGWIAAKAKWEENVRQGKAGADLAAQGALLLNNAAKAGDKTAWLDILHSYQLLGTNTAQGLQALRILKKLAPSDKLYMIRRSVEQMAKDMRLDTDITIDEALVDAFDHAETDEQRDAVLDEIQQNIADQIPSTFMDKFTALRYVNMLGNLRTQGRNIAGNMGMKAVRSVQNTVAAGIESIVSKASGGKLRRTRSATVSKAQKAAAAKDFHSLESVILDGGKYADTTADATDFAKGVQAKRRIFKNKALEGYRKATNWAMEQGDLIFAKDAYARALAGYLKANGITETDYSKIDTSVLDDARLFAVKEAQEATFRDTNWLSGWISKVGRRKDTPAAVKVLSEGVMPFRKTPANVLVRAEEYSPLGIINSLAISAKALRKGSDVTGAQVINSWAKSLTGTGIFGLGMMLQSLGLLSAGPDEDEDKDDFETMNGWQNYAITLPDGTNFTIDFLTPAAMPLLMGAQLMQLIRDGGFSVRDLESALTSLAEPMVQMSMLQGVNDTLENIQYADNNLGQLLINSGLSYLTQGLTNTLAGQLERTFEGERMQTYVDKDSALPDWLQRTLGKASAKIPGWDYSQIPYINAWGEEEENPAWYVNGIYNTLSPAYIEKGITSELTDELNRLNDAQSDINVYPTAPGKSVTYGGTEYNLSAEEYVALAKTQGQKQKELVESILGNSAYASLADAQKAAAIDYAYAYAKDYARGEVLEDHPGITTKWMAQIRGDVAEGILRQVAVGTTEKYTELPIEKASFVDELLSGLWDKPREDKPDGGKYTGVRQIQQIEAVVAADSELTEKQQKLVLQDILDEKAFAKYEKVTALGYDNDDFAEIYRLYLDTEGGKGNTIRALMRQQGISYAAAKQLYEIYNPK